MRLKHTIGRGEFRRWRYNDGTVSLETRHAVLDGLPRIGRVVTGMVLDSWVNWPPEKLAMLRPYGLAYARYEQLRADGAAADDVERARLDVDEAWRAIWRT